VTGAAGNACRIIGLAAVALLLATGAAAAGAGAPRIYRGRWIATAGGAPLHGRWSAQPTTRDEAIGSWTLLDQNEEVRLQGTWSARRSGRGWRGTWRAQVAGGTALAGSWTAAPPMTGPTFEDMLRAAADHQVSGTWRSGASHGGWWLQADE
jgi:hypothetical protein